MTRIRRSEILSSRRLRAARIQAAVVIAIMVPAAISLGYILGCALSPFAC